MAPITRKGQEPTTVPPLSPAADNVGKEGCGCSETPSSSSSSNQGGTGCPSVTYVSGGFSIVGRNIATGQCQIVNLDYIEDTQP